MATVSELIARTRLELADISKTFVHSTSSTGNTVTYNIPRVEQVQTDSLVVRVNGTPLAAQDYVLDAAAGIVTITGVPPNDGDTIQISGTHHKYFSDEVMRTFVETAFDLHTTRRNTTMARLPANEVYLVALLAKIEALWVLATDASYDIDIRTPEGVSVPRTQRFAQLMAMIEATTRQYKDLAMALGVGLFRVEMFTLRRQSMTTGRLVPVYMQREFDDINPPVRVYPPIDSQGAALPTPTVEELDVQVFRGEPFSEELIFEGEDLTGYTEIQARIHRTQYPIDRHHYSGFDDFTVDTSRLAEGIVTISLTEEQTARMRHYPLMWYLTWRDPNGVPDTPLRGTVLVETGAVYPS